MDSMEGMSETVSRRDHQSGREGGSPAQTLCGASLGSAGFPPTSQQGLWTVSSTWPFLGGQGRRGKSHPESRAFLKTPDDPRNARGLLPDSLPHQSARAFQGDLRLVPVLLGTHA